MARSWIDDSGGGELLGYPWASWRKVGPGCVELVWVVLFLNFVNDFRDAALPLQVELFWSEWLAHLL
jgi:hypothetical protein